MTHVPIDSDFRFDLGQFFPQLVEAGIEIAPLKAVAGEARHGT